MDKIVRLELNNIAKDATRHMAANQYVKQLTKMNLIKRLGCVQKGANKTEYLLFRDGFFQNHGTHLRGLILLAPN
jgi:hypothetical protein